VPGPKDGVQAARGDEDVVPIRRSWVSTSPIEDWKRSSSRMALSMAPAPVIRCTTDPIFRSIVPMKHLPWLFSGAKVTVRQSGVRSVTAL